MAPPKPKSVTVDWLQRNLLANQDPSLGLQSLKAHILMVEETVTVLPASSLDFQEVLKIFGFTEDNRDSSWSLASYELFEPPAALEIIQKEIEFVTSGAPMNEAYARCFLNNILVFCVGDERRLTTATTQSEPFTVPHTPPTIPYNEPEPAQLTLRFETELKFRVKYKNEARMLSGIADYTLWYDQSASYGANLVVVEAKRRRITGEADAQVVAYMGIVQKTRLEERRRNVVVYGISTDGDQFRFWRIDGDGVVSSSFLLEWQRGQASEIISFIRYIIRAAIASSPSTSTIKNSKKREVILSVFRDSTVKRLLDFGLGNLTLEPDDEDTEILDIPDI